MKTIIFIIILLLIKQTICTQIKYNCTSGGHEIRCENNMSSMNCSLKYYETGFEGLCFFSGNISCSSGNNILKCYCKSKPNGPYISCECNLYCGLEKSYYSLDLNINNQVSDGQLALILIIPCGIAVIISISTIILCIRKHRKPKVTLLEYQQFN